MEFLKENRKLVTISKLIDIKPRHLQSNILYSVKFLDCEADYVGETINSAYIDARIYQHKMVKDGQYELTKLYII